MLSIQCNIQQTNELTHEDVSQLIGLKKIYWPYSEEKQWEWFRTNTKTDDLHISLSVGGVMIAYLSAQNVEVSIDGRTINSLGIGTVCVDKQYAGNGYGRVLMSVVNVLVREKNTIGILVCMDDVVGFYKGAGWRIVNPLRTIVVDSEYDDNVMIYNPLSIVQNVEIREVTMNRRF